VEKEQSWALLIKVPVLDNYWIYIFLSDSKYYQTLYAALWIIDKLSDSAQIKALKTFIGLVYLTQQKYWNKIHYST
jgi:hypothetical protein